MKVAARFPLREEEAMVVRTLRNRKRLVRTLPHGGTVAEIGVQRGRFSSVILRYNQRSRLHLIDCWEQQLDQQHQADEANVSDRGHNENLAHMRRIPARPIRRGRVAIHRGYSIPVLATFPQRRFDWVFVDGNHTYEAVLADLEACLPRMKPGGVIAGHDYIDTRYWREKNFGGVEAVGNFCRRQGGELIFRTAEPGWEVDGVDNPSFAIRQAALPPLSQNSFTLWPFDRFQRAA